MSGRTELCTCLLNSDYAGSIPASCTKARYPSDKGEVCKTFIQWFDSTTCLQVMYLIDVYYRLRTMVVLAKIRKDLGKDDARLRLYWWWYKIAIKYAFTGRIIKPDNIKVIPEVYGG